MRDPVTPKQLARAINVSESSIKRWCDRGVIPAQYTAGGHRRLNRADVLAFLRTSKYRIVHPDALGLPPASGQSTRVINRGREQLTVALLAGDCGRCRQIAIDLYLAEHSLSVICDEVFAAAFREIGERWSSGHAEVYQERCGCEITLRVLHELQSLLPEVPVQAPLAIGGAASGDQYSLGTTMVELTLRDAKWNSISLGNDLPFHTLDAAIRRHRPQLFWLSCSYIADETEFLSDYGRLYEAYGLDVAFVIGGSALTDRIRRQMKFAAFCDNMQHLEGFAQTLREALSKGNRTNEAMAQSARIGAIEL